MTEPQCVRTSLRIWLADVFAFGNLAFLAVDIYLAHSANDFAHPAEWVPIWFSATCPALLLPGLLRPKHDSRFHSIASHFVGACAIVIGIAGMLLHLKGSFFEDLTLKSLVYTAPFAAPLSYAGVGLLLILNRLERTRPTEWGLWIVFLALCGFVGNLALSLCDHAQNGFFEPTEWIPVIASAFAVSYLFVAVWRPLDVAFLRSCFLVMLTQIVVGLLGFGLHGQAIWHGPAASTASNAIFGAPLFAPLLFVNLAILASIGIWELSSEALGPAALNDATEIRDAKTAVRGQSG